MYSINKKKTTARVVVIFSVLIVMVAAVQHVIKNITKQMEKTKTFLKTRVTECGDLTDQMNILPIAEDIIPPPNSIFFHETSCRRDLNSRQACSIESAARLHPHRNVYVFFNSHMSEADLKTGCLSTLVSYKNVKLARLNNNKYAKGTVLDNMLSAKLDPWSDFSVSHDADMLKFVTLYKYGGVYLDTDMLLVKPLDALGKNWAVRQSSKSVNAAVMAMSHDEVGHELAESAMEYFYDNFQLGEWSYDGLRALTLSLLQSCNTTNVLLMSASTCRGFEVYDTKMFYPYYFNNITYFLTGSANLNASENSDSPSFGYHLLNQYTITAGVKMGSPFEKLARKHCPLIREQFGLNFGADIEYWVKESNDISVLNT